jgi:hypothetical protein
MTAPAEGAPEPQQAGRATRPAAPARADKPAGRRPVSKSIVRRSGRETPAVG